MSVIISQQISATGVKEYTKVMRTFDSQFTPLVGQKIRDTAFGDMQYYDVEDVFIDLAENEYWVILPAVLLHSDDIEDIRDAVREYRSHGWECTKPL
ncbi:hypothetical protein C5G87_25535 [Paenibacillus peoriae]|uniref:hypothetical protein n=1 Tax=Paenibacillus TaxID=44249 RepID=UPI0008FC28DD|nr:MULTISPECIES: hypothetical protein [Paenibacillus]APB69775.1 hypothetical protein PPYC1_05050 [Paenibacillus polymyxa]OMF41834.1 hypothetical protein BK135_20245 [Paenibacillus peoriae]PPQ45973.1 hypothetical protein C5G87_25535 [Paenibacillus peoriae]QYK63899.1 hypothetical protein KAI37_04249 [Paenibacillus sp. S25]